MEARGSSSHSAPVPVVIYRRVPVGVGSSSSRPHSLGGMVRSGITGTYQLPGDASSRTGPSVISPSAGRAECHPDERQYVSCRLSPASGWHGLPQIVSDDFSHHPLGRTLLDPSGSMIHPRQEEQLNRLDQILLTEWFLLPRVFDGIYREFGRPHLTNKLPFYVSLVPEPLAWKQDVLHLLWNHLKAYTFPQFALLCQVISRVMESEGLKLLLVAPLWSQKERFADLLVAEPLELP